MVDLPKDFNWTVYVTHNEDLFKAGINTEKLAIKHYINNGYNENRVYKKNINKNNSISMISWLYHEKCYVELFVMYHIDIGFDKIYLLVDIKENTSEYEFLSKYHQVILIQNQYNRIEWELNNCFKTLDVCREQVDTEWVMLLGIDQFFFCKDLNVKKYLNELSEDILQFLFPFSLLINYSNDNFSLKNIEKYKCYRWYWNNVCCRTKYVENVTSHYFTLTQTGKILNYDTIEEANNNNNHIYMKGYSNVTPNKNYYMNNPYSLHFHCRNYYDLISKIKQKTPCGRYDRFDVDHILNFRVRPWMENSIIFLHIKDIFKKKLNKNIYEYIINNESVEEYIINKNIATKEEINNYIKTFSQNIIEKKFTSIDKLNIYIKQYLSDNDDEFYDTMKNNESIRKYIIDAGIGSKQSIIDYIKLLETYNANHLC